MASLPVLDGPVGRRISDAVLFVPEGLAVVRIAEVVRQSGVVTALPEGSWTVGPEAGRPGEVLQLSGGGSTPLDGLMRAGRSEEHTSELQSRQYLVCRLLLEKKKTNHLQA